MLLVSENLLHLSLGKMMIVYSTSQKCVDWKLILQLQQIIMENLYYLRLAIFGEIILVFVKHSDFL